MATRWFCQDPFQCKYRNSNLNPIFHPTCVLIFRFKNPTEHKSIQMKYSTFINAGEALVIYRPNPASGSTEDFKINHETSQKSVGVERIVLYGPYCYVPQPNEWTHEFKWHGTDPNNKTKKVYGALQFQKLRIIADQTYYNVNEVRTKDDTLLTVKLMIFFELKDINKMLDNTHDPMGDFINAAAADVVAYCATLTYEEFLEKTNALNDLV